MFSIVLPSASAISVIVVSRDKIRTAFYSLFMLIEKHETFRLVFGIALLVFIVSSTISLINEFRK